MKNYRSLGKVHSDARKQFLSSLAPLSCVAGTAEKEDYYKLSSKMPMNRNHAGHDSYSLEDIEAALRLDRVATDRNYN